MANNQGSKNNIRENYKVFVVGGSIIHLVEKTNPTAESTAKMRNEVIETAKRLSRPRLVLVDLVGVKKPPSKARQNLVEMFKSSDLDKCAIFGPSIVNRVVARFITAASGVKNVKFFSDEKDALEWLKE